MARRRTTCTSALVSLALEGLVASLVLLKRNKTWKTRNPSQGMAEIYGRWPAQNQGRPQKMGPYDKSGSYRRASFALVSPPDSQPRLGRKRCLIAALANPGKTFQLLL